MHKIPIRLIIILLLCYFALSYIILIPLQLWVQSISFSIVLSIIFVLLTMIYKSIIDGDESDESVFDLATDDGDDVNEENTKDESDDEVTKSDGDEWFNNIDKPKKKSPPIIKSKPKKKPKKDTPSRPIGRPKGSTKDTLKPKPKRKRVKLI